MSTIQKGQSKSFSNLDSQNRRLITIWIIVIATIKLLVINVYLLFCSNFLLLNSLGVKILLSTDSLLIGTIIARVIKYYFPTIKVL
ncbi:MAG: hypothetical protein JWR02_594 [Mucilaginibacter sp.]|nr:hypothetical protein [Mucilaginibacter sp.]